MEHLASSLLHLLNLWERQPWHTTPRHPLFLFLCRHQHHVGELLAARNRAISLLTFISSLLQTLSMVLPWIPHECFGLTSGDLQSTHAGILIEEGSRQWYTKIDRSIPVPRKSISQLKSFTCEGYSWRQPWEVAKRNQAVFTQLSSCPCCSAGSPGIAGGSNKPRRCHNPAIP